MNLARELKRIAVELEHDIQYVKLVRADNESELLGQAKGMGWETLDEMIQELKGYEISDLLGRYYVLGDDDGYLLVNWESLPSDLKPGVVSPIFVYAGQKVFDESAKGFLTSDKKEAYVAADDYEQIST